MVLLWLTSWQDKPSPGFPYFTSPPDESNARRTTWHRLAVAWASPAVGLGHRQPVDHHGAEKCGKSWEIPRSHDLKTHHFTYEYIHVTYIYIYMLHIYIHIYIYIFLFHRFISKLHVDFPALCLDKPSCRHSLRLDYENMYAWSLVFCFTKSIGGFLRFFRCNHSWDILGGRQASWGSRIEGKVTGTSTIDILKQAFLAF